MGTAMSRNIGLLGPWGNGEVFSLDEVKRDNKIFFWSYADADSVYKMSTISPCSLMFIA